jgi:hypothetical protein
MAEAYVLEEVSNATTTYYADDIPTLHNKLSRYNIDEPKYKPELLLFQGQGGKAGGSKNYTMTMQEWEDIMFYVLINIPEVLETFMR